MVKTVVPFNSPISYQVLTVVCFVLMSLHFYCVDVGNSHVAVIPTLLANSLLLSITFW